MVRFAPLIVAGGAVLDVASGTGRHARWFAARGHPVTALDRDAAALAVSGAQETICCDLEADADVAADPARGWPVADRRFAAVIVTRYLFRPSLPRIVAALAPGGVLIYETFAVGNASFGRPSNPAFLLAEGELIDVCRGLSIVAYEDGLVDTPRPASIQRVCAVRPDGAARRHAL